MADGAFAWTSVTGKGSAIGLIKFLVGDDPVIGSLRQAAFLGTINAQPDQKAQRQFLPSGGNCQS